MPGSDERCRKPGCGALRLLCTDYDCPQLWVHHKEHTAALASRDKEIERLKALAERVQHERRTLRYEVACVRARAEAAEALAATATRERDEALEQLRMQWCEACGTVSADGECDCTKFPETAGLRRAFDFAKTFGETVREAVRERDEARAECERLRTALSEARGDMEAWGAYASAYFQEKHDLPGDLAKIDAALHPEGGNDGR